MPLLPQNEIADAHSTDLVEIFENFLGKKGKQAGTDVAFVCPFHNDKTPSMMVSRDKGVYHCLGCGSKGNAISFLQNYQGISFVEAVNYLNGKTTEESKPLPPPPAKIIVKREVEDKPVANSQLLMDFLAELLGYISDEDCHRVEDYLNSRALSTMDFGFGVSAYPTLYPIPRMNYEAFQHTKKALLEKYTMEELMEHGLYSAKGFSQYMSYDFFFVYYGEMAEGQKDYPITNLQARRIAPKEGEQREAFIKGKQVLPFNLHMLSILPYKSNVFLVEAPIDAVSLNKILKSPLFLDYRGSKPYVVSTGGSTIKSERIIQICQQQSHKVWLCMDNDTAGKRATAEWLEKFTSHGIVTDVFDGIPANYKDPNEYLQDKQTLFC